MENISRKNFLNSAAKTALGLGSASFLMQCSNLVRRDLSSPKEFSSDLPYLDNDGLSILYHASLAPSAHNSQPWFVQIHKDKSWTIGIDEQRRLPAVDADGRAALFSMGAFLENLAQAAQVLGYDAQMEILAKSAADKDVAKVELKKSRPIGKSLQRIERRMTVRRNLLSDPLKEEDLRKLIGQDRDRVFYFPRSTKHAQCIEEAQVRCYKVQNERKEAMEELKHWFRLNNRTAEKYRDGLTLGGMGLDGMAGFYIRNFMSPDDMISESSKKMAIDANNQLVKEGSGWFIFTAGGNAPGAVIESGRRFEAMALTARDLNIALAPMTQTLEEERDQKIFQTNHTGEIHPVLIVRAGYIKSYPEPVTLRRPVQWFIRHSS